MLSIQVNRRVSACVQRAVAERAPQCPLRVFRRGEVGDGFFSSGVRLRLPSSTLREEALRRKQQQEERVRP